MRPFAAAGTIGAALLPLLYFGAQFAAAAATPGYRWRRDIVSLLGANGAPAATAFNLAMVGSGLAAMAAAVWLAAACERRWPLAGLAAAVALVGGGNIWAGVFPLPDARHLANPFLPAFSALPALAVLAAWSARLARPIMGYALLNLFAFTVLSWLRAGAVADPGFWQRLHALTVYLPPVVVASAWAASRARQQGVSAGLSVA